MPTETERNKELVRGFIEHGFWKPHAGSQRL
jgi:hypothetical protein